MDAAPFRGVRHDPSVAGPPTASSAPAYDDVGPFGYARHRTANPYTVLELITPDEDGGYAGARATLDRWSRTGVLVQEPRPAFYLYEERERHAGVPTIQRGVLASVRLSPLDGSGDLLPHERVFPDRVTERLARLRAVPLDVTPIYALLDRGDASVRELFEVAPERAPLVAFTDERGVDHRIWALDGDGEISAIRAGLAGSRAVIADGHHRYAAALTHQSVQRAAAGSSTGGGSGDDAPWDRALVYLVDTATSGPRVAAVHRVAEALPDDLARRLGAGFHLDPAPPDPPELLASLEAAGRPAVALRRASGEAWMLRPRGPGPTGSHPSDRPPEWFQLDAVALLEQILPLLEIEPDDLLPMGDADSAVTATARGPSSGAFLLRPVPLQTLLVLAQGKHLLPPKTTAFQPKPRTGLIMRPHGLTLPPRGRS